MLYEVITDAIKPTIMITVSIGIFFASPPRSLMILVPVALWITPADINMMLMISPWENCWNMAPETERATSPAEPRVTKPMWLRP